MVVEIHLAVLKSRASPARYIKFAIGNQGVVWTRRKVSKFDFNSKYFSCFSLFLEPSKKAATFLIYPVSAHTP